MFRPHLQAPGCPCRKYAVFIVPTTAQSCKRPCLHYCMLQDRCLGSQNQASCIVEYRVHNSKRLFVALNENILLVASFCIYCRTKSDMGSREYPSYNPHFNTVDEHDHKNLTANAACISLYFPKIVTPAAKTKTTCSRINYSPLILSEKRMEVDNCRFEALKRVTCSINCNGPGHYITRQLHSHASRKSLFRNDLVACVIDLRRGNDPSLGCQQNRRKI